MQHVMQQARKIDHCDQYDKHFGGKKLKSEFCWVPCGFENPENITLTQTTAMTVKITEESNKKKLTMF